MTVIVDFILPRQPVSSQSKAMRHCASNDAKTAVLTLPGLWLIYIASLRALSVQEGLAVDELNDRSCLSQAYPLSFIDGSNSRTPGAC